MRFDDGLWLIWLWEICCCRSRSPYFLPDLWATYFNFSLWIIKIKFVLSQNKNSQQRCVLQVKWEDALDVVVPNVQDLQPNAIGQRFWKPSSSWFFLELKFVNGNYLEMHLNFCHWDCLSLDSAPQVYDSSQSSIGELCHQSNYLTDILTSRIEDCILI
jgi:hypothetical protein